MDIAQCKKEIEKTRENPSTLKEEILSMIETGKKHGLSIEKVYQAMIRSGYNGSLQTVRRIYKKNTSKNKEN